MAKKSILVRDQKRQMMIDRYAAKRAELKELGSCFYRLLSGNFLQCISRSFH